MKLSFRVLSAALPLLAVAIVAQMDDDVTPYGDNTMGDDAIMPSPGLAVFNVSLNECLVNETCGFPFDGVCDVPDYCDPGTDCFDCGADPCKAHSYNCSACSENGCVWCAGDAFCSSEPLPADILADFGRTSSCPTADDYQTTCEAVGADNVFTDPLYDSMKWAYELINVEPVWRMGLTGARVHVRVNDDGVDADHPEFATKFDRENSCDDYMPVFDEEEQKIGDHGTACASLILASGDNDVCAVGIAPGATVSACVLVGSASNPLEEEERIGHNFEVVDVSSNSWGPLPCTPNGRRHLQEQCSFNPDHSESPCSSCGEAIDFDDDDCYNAVVNYCANNYELDPMACANYLDWYVDCDYAPLPSGAGAALTQGILEGRGGLGIIYPWAAGNDYATGVDVNGDAYANSRYTISVAAVGKDGLHASYSTPGAANFIAAPGGDRENLSNNIVANPGGGCHDITVGTSFATPTVSGVVALMLEANPGLGWRDVQGLLAITAALTDLSDDSWVSNGIGLPHSNKYGFGIVDAYAAVNASKTWSNWGPEQQIMKDSGIIDLAIANDPEATATSTFVVAGEDNFVAESVSVYLDLDHSTRGDLHITLTSPSGTESVLHPGPRPETSQTIQSWKLTTVKNYFENPNGNWILNITDQHPQNGTAGECLDLDYFFLAPNETSGEVAGFLFCEFINNETFGLCGDGEVLDESMHAAFDDGNGNITAAQACCGCGGGNIVSDVESLVSWKMIVYGHIEGVGEEVTAVAKRIDYL